MSVTETILSPAAQRILALCLERIDSASQEDVDLRRTCAILSAAGLRLVDQDDVEAKPDIMDALITIASAITRDRDGMLRKLVWED